MNTIFAYIIGVIIGGCVGYKHGKKHGIREGEERELARVNRAIIAHYAKANTISDLKSEKGYGD